MVAQEAKFELVKYNSQGKNYPDNKDYGYALTEYLIKLYDADGYIELYHITDYYNDNEEIIHTKIWRLENKVSVEYDNEIKVDINKRIIPILRFQSTYELCPENISVLEGLFINAK